MAAEEEEEVPVVNDDNPAGGDDQPAREKKSKSKSKTAEDGTRQRKSSRKKVKCPQAHTCKADPQPQHVCDICKRKGTYARCSGGCDYDICVSCYEAKGGVVSKQAKEAKAVTENPFMGWEGWPPTSVVIVTLVLGLIFEVVFCIGFWQFWTSGDSEEIVEAATEAASDAAEAAADAAEDLLENLTSAPPEGSGDGGTSTSE